ncbi:MAG: hypothetical protein AAGA56_03125, partial [Myxococcota bacterium]
DQVVRYRKATGGTVTVRCRGKAIRRDGQPVRMLGAHTLVDDTDEQRTSRLLADTVNFSGDAIILWSNTEGVSR